MAISNFEVSEVIFYPSPASNVVDKSLSKSVQAFNEKQDFVLTQDVAFNNPDDWTKKLGTIPLGTAVDSHYIWFKPGFVNDTTFFRATATITFDTPILGIIGGNQELLDSNNLLGISGMVYPDNKFGSRQMDNTNPNGSKDTAIAIGNVLKFDVTARDGIDPVRVITAAFPKPGSQPPVTPPTTPSTSPTPSDNRTPPIIPVIVDPPIAPTFAPPPTPIQAGISGIKSKQGTGNGDRLQGDSKANLLIGKAGKDQINSKQGKDTIRCGAGDDRASGGSGNDRIEGGAGEDRLLGGANDDLLIGDGGKDWLLGQQGNDVLIGKQGNDTLVGGTGADVFVLTQLKDGVDRIQDFTVGTDLIELRGIFSAAPTSAQFEQFIQLVQQGNNTQLSINSDGIGSDFKEIALLQNIAANTLKPASFAIT